MHLILRFLCVFPLLHFFNKNECSFLIMSLHGCLPREGQAYFILIFFWWWGGGGLVEATVSFIGVDNHNTHKVYRYLLNTSK